MNRPVNVYEIEDLLDHGADKERAVVECGIADVLREELRRGADPERTHATTQAVKAALDGATQGEALHALAYHAAHLGRGHHDTGALLLALQLTTFEMVGVLAAQEDH